MPGRQPVAASDQGEGPILLSVGRLTERKGLVQFITHAMPLIVAEHPHARLVVVGDDAPNALRKGAGDPSRDLLAAIEEETDRLSRFVAGDLLGIVPSGDQPVPRYYSLASGTRDGFVEICVRRMPGGVCSTYLHGLQPGDHAQAFIRPNPGFVLHGSRQPVLLIGAGTGVAPLAGFIRGNARHRPMHLYYGTRDPARDFYFGEELQAWQVEGRLADLHTTFSRTPDGGGYVQEALRRDAAQVRDLLARTDGKWDAAWSRPPQQGV